MQPKEPSASISKRKPPMKVAHDPMRPKDEPAFRCQHVPLFRSAAIDRLLLLLEHDRKAGGRQEVDLSAVSAALGTEVTPAIIQARAAKVVEWAGRLAELVKTPGVTQRTPEWYEARKTMITASDAAQALGCGKFGTQRTFFQKKCGAPEEQAAFDASLPPLKWGVMFEPVAQAIYSAANMGVRVHEFGLLRHPTLPFIGASPDGISALGVMLEIKCPWRRRIVEGEVPMQYYYQIQAQLAVCGLDECDYFECEFFEVDGPADPAWADPDLPAHERGVFLELPGSAAAAAEQDPAEKLDPVIRQTTTLPPAPKPPPTFEYPPGVVGLGAEELSKWVEERCAALQGTEIAHWWVLRRHATARIQYDAAFSDDMFARLAKVWDRTLEYRGDRQLYLDDVGAAQPPAPSSGNARNGPLETDADAVAKFSAPGGFAFVDDE